jgi:hypothetical protein
MRTASPGDWYPVLDLHNREIEAYLLLECLGRAGTNYYTWRVRTSGLFGEEIVALLPIAPKEEAHDL